LQGKTIKQYALERLFPGPDDERLAWDELKSLIEQRVADGLAGKVSAKSAAEIFHDELGQNDRA
jgi:hypothetical protein